MHWCGLHREVPWRLNAEGECSIPRVVVSIIQLAGSQGRKLAQGAGLVARLNPARFKLLLDQLGALNQHTILHRVQGVQGVNQSCLLHP